MTPHLYRHTYAHRFQHRMEFMMSDAWDDTEDAWSKVRENKVRRAAERQGYAISRNRRRDPKALGYGTYSITGTHPATATASAASLTLSQVEDFLINGKGLPDGNDKTD